MLCELAAYPELCSYFPARPVPDSRLSRYAIPSRLAIAWILTPCGTCCGTPIHSANLVPNSKCLKTNELRFLFASDIRVKISRPCKKFATIIGCSKASGLRNKLWGEMGHRGYVAHCISYQLISVYEESCAMSLITLDLFYFWGWSNITFRLGWGMGDDPFKVP